MLRMCRWDDVRCCYTRRVWCIHDEPIGYRDMTVCIPDKEKCHHVIGSEKAAELQLSGLFLWSELAVVYSIRRAWK